MTSIDDHTIAELSIHIREKLGLYFPPKKYVELRQKLLEIAKEKGYKKTEDFVNFIINETDNKKLVEILASKLSIGETYFWRDRELFRTLEDSILPKIIEEKNSTNKTLRIWSAGSATGEEAYSIAILLKRLIPDIKKWNITILATDINPIFLAKAKIGEYTEWSFRSAPQWLKELYFVKKNNHTYRLNDEIKKMVSFSYLNLIHDNFPSLANNTNGMDVIFCRNVLMYFAIEDIKSVSGKLYNCLVDDGFLFTTPSESFQYISARFKYSRINNVFVYQRKLEKELINETLNKKEKSPNKEVITYTRTLKRKTEKKKPLKTKRERIVGPPKNNHGFLDAKELYNKGFYHEAESILNDLIKQKSEHESYILMARIKANLGKLDEALAYCESSFKLNKLSPEVYYLNAMIEAEKGEIETAYKLLKKSFFLDSSFIITNYSLASFAILLNKKEESIKHYQNTLELLSKLDDEEIVPESDGITAGRLKEIINTTLVN